ncbi:MAG: hypothetical protein B6I35_09805 [Anaerolineaceae bacterium 4572_32.2]|nr:MAG: hypothetical protein B6I35_09805 [Anaerolineaceae bacterium 4572_32.2]
MHTETPISDVTRQLGADGSVRDPIEVAREKTDRILATHQPEPVDEAVQAEFERILQTAEREID